MGIDVGIQSSLGSAVVFVFAEHTQQLHHVLQNISAVIYHFLAGLRLHMQ